APHRHRSPPARPPPRTPEQPIPPRPHPLTHPSHEHSALRAPAAKSELQSTQSPQKQIKAAFPGGTPRPPPRKSTPPVSPPTFPRLPPPADLLPETLLSLPPATKPPAPKSPPEFQS